jgi:adenylate cyclase
MTSRIIKYIGLIFIVIFSAVSIFISIAQRDLANDDNKFSYTSFFEDRFYDFRMLKNIDRTSFDDRILLVAIDDYSIKKIGKWPFPREAYTTLMNKLKIFGAKVISWDVFFSEESLVCPGVKTDYLMGEAIKNFQEIPGNKVVLPYSLDQYPDDSYEEVPEVMYDFVMDTKQAEGMNLRESFMAKRVFPLPILYETEAGIAHIEAQADQDGIFRHYPLVGNVDELYFPSLSLMTYQYFTGDSPVLEMLTLDENILKLKTGQLSLNYAGETKVRWFGGESSFPKIPFWDVMNAPDDDPKMKERFNNNIVFVGSTAFGAHDLRHTPVDAQMPGVYFHMNMTHMLLEGNFFRPQDKSALYSWAIMIGATLFILIVQFFGNALIDLLSVVLTISGLYLLDTYYLLPQGYEVKLAFCFFSVLACYSWNTFLHFYSASKDKQFLKEAFGTYISPELIDEMYTNGESPQLGGDSGIRTAYFTDIQGFSTFSEKLTATQLVELLNEYLTVMTDLLLEVKGTLDKYEGDAIIAFFGAPMPLEDHARRACLVAHQMQEALLDLRKKWISEGEKWPEVVHEMRMRIGINSGEIVTGNMGSKSRMNYTMMGDSVNLAARLEESAKQYGIFTQVSKDTKEMAGDEFLWREVDTVKVMGKSIPVTSFDLLGLNETAPDFLKELAKKFADALELYRAQNFKEAMELFKETLELEWQRFPDLKGIKSNPSEVYIERCQTYIDTPPGTEWDGVWTLTSK